MGYHISFKKSKELIKTQIYQITSEHKRQNLLQELNTQ